MKHYRKRMNFCLAVLDLKWRLFCFYNDEATFEDFHKTEAAKKWSDYYYHYVYQILIHGEPQEGTGLIGVGEEISYDKLNKELYGVSPLKAKDEI